MQLSWNYKWVLGVGVRHKQRPGCKAQQVTKHSIPKGQKRSCRGGSGYTQGPACTHA